MTSVAETFLQLLVDAVARAVADQRAELQPLFARLAQQQRDVGIVAGMEDHVGPGTLQLGDQRRKIGRGRRITFLQHDVEAGLLGAGHVALGYVDAVGAVLVDDGDAQILRLLAELGLGVLGDEVHRHQAELVAARLRTEDILVVLVLEHRRGNAGGDPHELLELLDPGGHRHALRRREEAEQHVDLFLLDQAHRLVDGDIGLALGVGIDRLDLVAFDAGLGVLVEHDLGADILQLRAAARQRAGQVENDADLDFLFLGVGGSRHAQRRNRGQQPTKHAGSLTHQHQNLPGIVHCVYCVVAAHHTGSAGRCQAPRSSRACDLPAP